MLHLSSGRVRRYYTLISLGLCLSLLFTFLPPQEWNRLVYAQEAAVTSSNLGGNAGSYGMLMDIGALEDTREVARQPAALANPISVSRVQSSYEPVSGSPATLVVTFTVTNNQPPVMVPEVPEGATVTDTLQALANFDFANDPHTVRDVLLVDTLTSNATFVAAMPQPDQQQPHYVWSLGDIPPLQSVTATLTLRATAAGSDFTLLDNRATAWGVLGGRQVSAHAYPMLLSPAGMQPWLRSTPDATTTDSYVLEQAGELGQDPMRLFAFVYALGYEVYKGSLRGARGTMWSEAGNALDKSSLLISMLRASGIPARYRHGTLTREQAQPLIRSMFPQPTQVIGHIPAGTPVSDPANDPKLLAEAQDHWWVEAYLPEQGWRDLDTLAPRFAIGERLVRSEQVATDGTDQIAEVPDALRHKVTLRLKVEQYVTEFFVGGLETFESLNQTFNTVDLVGNPVTLRHWVETDQSGGFLFGEVTHWYQPFLVLQDTAYTGDIFQDKLSNFQIGNKFTTAEWLLIDTRDPDGQVQSYTRELVDQIGFAQRQTPGSHQVKAGSGAALLADQDVFTLYASVSKVDFQAPGRIGLEMQQLAPRLRQLTDTLQAIEQNHPQGKPYSEVELATMREAQGVSRRMTRKMGEAAVLALSASSDLAAERTQRTSLVHAYAVQPQLTIFASRRSQNRIHQGFDLLARNQRAIAYPGQARQAETGFRTIQGMLDTVLEDSVLEEMTGATAVSAVDVLQAARQTGIALRLITVQTLDKLVELPISSEAKARIGETVEQGRVVLVPERMVMLEGKQTIAWWDIDPQSGQMIGVNENGWHGTEEISYLENFLVVSVGFLFGLFTGILVSLFIGVVYLIDRYVYDKSPKEAGDRAVRRMQEISDVTTLLFGAIGCTFGVGIFTGGLLNTYLTGVCGGLGLGLWMGAKMIEQMLKVDPPLPPIYVSRPETNAPSFQAQTVVTRPRTHTAPSITANLATSFAMVSAPLTAQWQRTQQAFAGAALNAPDARLSTAGGNTIGEGAVQAEPFQAGSLGVQAQGTGLAVDLTARGSATFHAPAVTGLGAGTAWNSYTVRLTTNGEHTLRLSNAAASVNGGNLTTGDLVVTVDGTTTVTGTGGTAMPTFVPTVTLQVQNASLLLGPSSDGFQVGGQSVQAPNGLALAGYSGAIQVSEASAMNDRIALTGDAAFFTLNLSPATSSSDTTAPVSFQASIVSNRHDTYTMTVEGPEGWQVAIDTTGWVTATPPAGATPDAYTLLVTAQSHTHPALIVAATHTVTTRVHQGMILTVAPDPLITVPWGPANAAALPGNTNNGQLQLTGSAFTVDITNTSTAGHTFNMAVDGLPEGWLVLSGAEGQTETTLTLPAGGIGQIGLYISPTLGLLPPPGTVIPFTVQAAATDAAGLVQEAAGSFTMPAIAFSQIAAPALVYSSPGMTTTFEVGLHNIGNTTGTFPVLVTPFTDTWSVAVNSPLTLDAGQVISQNVMLQTPDGAIGSDYPVLAQTTAGAYTQTVAVMVRMVNPRARDAYQGSETAAGSNPVLGAILDNVGRAITDLDANPANLTLRNQLVAHLLGLVRQLVRVPCLADTDDLRQIALRLQQHSTPAEIRADLDALGTSLGQVQRQLTLVTRYCGTVQVLPGVASALPEQAVTYNLQLTNHGDRANTYRITLASSSLPNLPQPAPVTVAAGTTITVPVVLRAAQRGFYQVQSAVEAVDTGGAGMGVRSQANASLRVVTAFVQVLQVVADPSFVETGDSSTRILATLANPANVSRTLVAHTEIRRANGITAWTKDQPFNLRMGDPFTYTLGAVDTTGWTSGVYTVSVELREPNGIPMLNGTGYGYLVVGEGLAVEQGIFSPIVAPGNPVVTTYITTTVRQPFTPSLSGSVSQRAQPGNATSTTSTGTHPEAGAASSRPVQSSTDAQPGILSNGTGIVRHEENDSSLAYTGTWFDSGSGRVSSGAFRYSDTAGNTAVLTFTGTWISPGFLASIHGGQAEVFIDGVSRGMVDTYNRDQDVISRVYTNLGAGTHVLSITVLGTRHPYALSSRVQLDYIDTWDGTPMPDGIFEQNNARVYASSNWTTISDTLASGGDYLRGGYNVWFHFTGDTVTFQGLRFPGTEEMRVSIDGQEVGVLNIRPTEGITTTRFTFGNLGAGPHVLLVQYYRGTSTVDFFSTPGNPPFFSSPDYSGLARYEEDAPALRYNGLPLGQTRNSWSPGAFNFASSGYYVASRTSGDTVSLDFTGPWVSLGVATGPDAGQAEVFIDGVSRGVIDTYSPERDVAAHFYTDLVSSTHTLSMTVLGTRNPAASSANIFLDYIDVWDGTPTPESTFEQEDTPVYRSSNWTYARSPLASGGNYRTTGSNAWFLFTGNSVTYHAMTDRTVGSSAEVFIDGVSQGVVDLTYGYSFSPRTFDYTGLGEGPHVLHIKGQTHTTIDAFSAPAVTTVGVPMVEWTIPITVGATTTPATGDINGDGIVEIALVDDAGTLRVYRGDGADAGNGGPLLWSANVGGADGLALADLDGEAGAEIVVGSNNGVSAYHADGTLYWFTNTVTSRLVAIANMDSDSEPEIVANGTRCPCVLESDGRVSWTAFHSPAPLTPMLSDFTGDGRLDILMLKGNSIVLYDYAQNPPAVVWERAFNTTLVGRGSPAIADATGDGKPEVAVVADGFVHLVGADGQVIWSYETAPGAPGGVSIADIDGDGKVEIVASAQVSNGPNMAPGRLYALEGDGSLLWEALAPDSTSANSVSTLDLDGDGAWEIIWNGANQGISVYRGTDGRLLYSEPLVYSFTILDYPIVADVDSDGHAEIVTVGDEGFAIIGHDKVWASARSIWNQYDYHITNINDDLTVPATEPQSWKVHNTYRTQSNLKNPVPVYPVTVMHTLRNGVEALPDTFSLPPNRPAPNLRWQYEQGQFEPARSIRFSSRLRGMQPGEVRQVSQGTEVVYQLSSGTNRLTLPPLYVAAQHIIRIAPEHQTALAGGQVQYAVTLVNPGVNVYSPDGSETYTLTVTGLPEGWASLPLPVVVPARSSVTVPLTLTVPPDTTLNDYPFTVEATTSTNGTDQAQAGLRVVDLLQLEILPAVHIAGYGETVTYTLRVANRDAASHTYRFVTMGLEGNQVQTPSDLTVAAHGTATTTLVATARAPVRSYPFQVTASYSVDGQPIQAGDEAVLVVLSELGVAAELMPPEVIAGRGTPAAFRLGVHNTGSLRDRYSLTVQLPTGWNHTLTANGVAYTSLELRPFVANEATLQLLVSPPADMLPGTYPVTVTVTSQTDAAIQAVAVGQVQVLPQGVTVELSPENTAVNPDGSPSWDVRVTNTGMQADTFTLSASGLLSTTARFSTDVVALDAGASTTVQLTASRIPFALADSYNVVAVARSQTAPQVSGSDTARLGLVADEGVAVEILPASVRLTDTLSVSYLVLITNTGNLANSFVLTASSSPAGPDVALELSEVFLPVGATAGMFLTVRSPQDGTYTLTVGARSEMGQASSSDTAILEVGRSTRPAQQRRIYLPFVKR